MQNILQNLFCLEKPGGGRRPQPYSPINGQYIEKNILLLNDYKALYDVKWFHKTFDVKPHFPTFGIHDQDKQYNREFVLLYRSEFNSPTLPDSKILKYLLDPEKAEGKDKYLNSFGYFKDNWLGLWQDIMYGTYFETVKYNKMNKYSFKVKALTRLWGGNVTTIWQVDPKTYQLQFVTLIPREDAYYDDK